MMQHFNFHHHNPAIRCGIYNLDAAIVEEGLYHSAGLHPKDIRADWENRFADVKRHAQNPFCLAIGECGLDSLAEASLPVQQDVFAQHVSLANDLNKPLILHCVRQFDLLMQICRASKVPKIIHGFNRNGTLAHQLIAQGFYLSFGAALLQNVSLQQILQQLPGEKFFLETDNSSTDISEVYNKAAEVRGCSPQEITDQIYTNLKTVFHDSEMVGAHRTAH